MSRPRTWIPSEAEKAIVLEHWEKRPAHEVIALIQGYRMFNNLPDVTIWRYMLRREANGLGLLRKGPTPVPPEAVDTMVECAKQISAQHECKINQLLRATARALATGG